jgi:hypothetical protein
LISRLARMICGVSLISKNNGRYNRLNPMVFLFPLKL